MIVVATETGLYGGTLRYRGHEFEIPDSKKLMKWVVKKGSAMPAPLKPFAKTVKDLAAMADPKKAENTISGRSRAEQIAEELRRSGKTEQPKQQQQPKAP